MYDLFIIMREHRKYMSEVKNYHTIGLMSGTSLDGLDIAYCVFSFKGNEWSYQIRNTATIDYPALLLDKLKRSTQLSGLALSLLDIALGRWIGEETNQFIQQHHLSIDLIASHGHTVFHQPEKRLTLQIGNGQEIFNSCQVLVINDFRSKDVSLGGHGAPLVPIGDQLLFGEYEGCLNLGGIANISFQQNNQRIAYDIAPVNIVLNMLSQQLGKPYDDQGKIAKKGDIDLDLIGKLSKLDFYKIKPPKSLGYEWIEANVFPLLENMKQSTEDKLATFTEHIAQQMAKHLPSGKTLITGGGAYNKFLIERLDHHISDEQTLEIPDATTLEYKEAMIFAFLGVLRTRNETNCLSSVTGASMNNCGGMIYSN